MERRKKKDNSGFYIALCCCAVIIAAVGYAGRISLVEEKEPELARVAEPLVSPLPTAAPTVQEAENKSDADLTVNNNVVIEEPFRVELPVEGKVIAEFSGDDLVYNEVLKDWRAHSGIDFSSHNGEVVRAGADGVVEDVFDSELGRCVIINHKDGFATMYANLGEDTTLKKGDKIVRGDRVGSVGNTALGDVTDGEHLHFEITKDGINVNPLEYLD